ncbi:MAG: hypothetical protein QOE70_2855 [Chthoniobacter sp.]|jgi:allophanate hydrolase subunit 1|nr:hypothetical protein [Chthoniobacter sp.]
MSLPENPSGAEEFLEAQIQIAALTPVVEQSVHEALDALPGVARVTVGADVVTVDYDPTLTTQDALVAALKGASVEVVHSETHRDSPISEIEDQVERFLPQGPPEHPSR